MWKEADSPNNTINIDLCEKSPEKGDKREDSKKTNIEEIGRKAETKREEGLKGKN